MRRDDCCVCFHFRSFCKFHSNHWRNAKFMVERGVSCAIFGREQWRHNHRASEQVVFFLLFKLLNKVISAATRATKTDNAFVMLCGIVVCTRLLALTFWTASHSSAIWPNDFSAVFSTSFGKRGRPKAKQKRKLSTSISLHTLDFRSVWPELNNGMLSDAHFEWAKGVYQKLRRGMTCQYWLLEILTTTKKRTHFSKETLKNVHFVLFHLNIRSPSTAAQLTNERVKCTIIFYENMD